MPYNCLFAETKWVFPIISSDYIFGYLQFWFRFVKELKTSLNKNHYQCAKVN